MTEKGPGVNVPAPCPLEVDSRVLDDLWDRIRRTRWSDSIAGADWSHGTSIDYLRELSA
jgi:microsomal epoxide hydrolase